MTNPSASLELRAGATRAVVSPVDGGRLASLVVDGVHLLKTDGLGPLHWGMYPMVPWAGRLRDGLLRWRDRSVELPTSLMPPHAIHGTAVEVPWEVLTNDDRSVTLATGLGSDWPFGGRAVVTWSLTDEALYSTITLVAEEAEFPAIAGWHPWFPRQLRGPTGGALGGPAVLVFEAGGMLERGSDGLPTGRILRPPPPEPWDDCFVDVKGVPVVRWPGAFEITVETDCAYWVCYTDPPDALCVEPQTGPPNGLNTGECSVVAPGRPLDAEVALRWRRLSPR